VIGWENISEINVFVSDGTENLNSVPLFQARIQWEGCGRKGIWHKNGDDRRGSLISPDGVAPTTWWCVSLCYLLLHHKSPEEYFFWHQITRVVPEKGP